jgi:hypothetical protein
MLPKTKSRKKRGTTAAAIRANAKTIAIVVVLIVVFSGASFYLGLAAPRIIASKSFDFVGFPDINDFTNVTLSAPYTGVKISIHVAYVTDYWGFQVYDMYDNLVYSYLGYYAESHSSPFIAVPGGCKIFLQASSGSPWTDLEGHLTVVASGPPFII